MRRMGGDGARYHMSELDMGLERTCRLAGNGARWTRLELFLEDQERLVGMKGWL